jgi:hypothetical protein
MNANTYAADASGRRITQTRFDLSLDPPTQKSRTVRPGLTVLRPNPESSSACTYSDDLSQPMKAAKKKGGAK